MQGQKEAWGADKASMAVQGYKKKYAYTAKDFWDGVDGWHPDAHPDDARRRVSRADFDEYYEPSDFVDRVYGGIDGSAAGGEVL